MDENERVFDNRKRYNIISAIHLYLNIDIVGFWNFNFFRCFFFFWILMKINEDGMVMEMKLNKWKETEISKKY